jgi:glucokinase
MGIANIINLLNPALIVLGGGVAVKLWDPLLEAARPEIELRVFPSLKRAVQIVPAGLGEDSAVLGAAGLVHFDGWK